MNERYLEHHGIKGQRWGNRRYQRKDGTLTDAGQKRYGDDITFKKGDSYSHISEQKKINFANRSTYAISKLNDMRVYGGTYASAMLNKQARAGVKDPKIYVHVLKNKHSGIIAGEKTMRSMFEDMMNKHEKLMDTVMKADYDKAVKQNIIKDKTPYNVFKKDKDRMFELFVRSTLNSYSVTDSRGKRNQYLYAPTVILGDLYTKSLQKKKYAGMLDLNDKGRWYGAEEPTIIFNGKKYLKDSYVKDLPAGAVARMASEIHKEGRVNRQLEPI